MLSNTPMKLAIRLPLQYYVLSSIIYCRYLLKFTCIKMVWTTSNRVLSFCDTNWVDTRAWYFEKSRSKHFLVQKHTSYDSMVCINDNWAQKSRGRFECSLQLIVLFSFMTPLMLLWRHLCYCCAVRIDVALNYVVSFDSSEQAGNRTWFRTTFLFS